MKILILTLAIFGFVVGASASESIPEKAHATVKTVKRSVKKGLHRTTESLCGKLTGDNKAQCLVKEAKNRLEEGTDTVVDKASEVKNSVDSEK